MAETQPAGVNLVNLQKAFDEHEQRTAQYLGRDLDHQERLRMGIDGLCDYCKEGRSISEFQASAEVMEAKLNEGETVGTALVAAIRSLIEE